MNNFEKMLLRLKEQLGVPTDKEAAELLGLSDKALNARKKRDASLDDKLLALIAKRPELKIDFIYITTGEIAERPHLTKPELAALSKEVFGDAPARLAQNSNAEFEARLKRVAFATQTSSRIYEDLGFVPSSDGIGLLQMLLFNHDLDEAGARLIVEYMKRQEK